jgi:hypothetical protein
MRAIRTVPFTNVTAAAAWPYVRLSDGISARGTVCGVLQTGTPHGLAVQCPTCLRVRIKEPVETTLQSFEAAGVPQSLWCLTTHWTTGFLCPAEAKDISSTHCVQTSSEAHPASYPTGTGGPFSGGKARPGRDSDHSSLWRAKVKNE